MKTREVVLASLISIAVNSSLALDADIKHAAKLERSSNDGKVTYHLIESSVQDLNFINNAYTAAYYVSENEDVLMSLEIQTDILSGRALGMKLYQSTLIEASWSDSLRQSESLSQLVKFMDTKLEMGDLLTLEHNQSNSTSIYINGELAGTIGGQNWFQSMANIWTNTISEKDKIASNL